jgi:hypothetical protein
VLAATDSGGIIDFGISGNVTNSQMSNVTIGTNRFTATTTVSFAVTGKSGTTGFSNITISKSAVPYLGIPTIYVDNQSAQNQGYTQDTINYYLWYTTHFSTHRVTIQFQVHSKSPSTAMIPIMAVAITAPEIILMYTIIAVQRLRRKPENI